MSPRKIHSTKTKMKYPKRECNQTLEQKQGIQQRCSMIYVLSTYHLSIIYALFTYYLQTSEKYSEKINTKHLSNIK